MTKAKSPATFKLEPGQPESVQADRSWKVLQSETIVSRRWFELRKEHVRLQNGTELEEFFVVGGPAWASAVCLTDADELVFVRQYRHGLRRASLELPAGVIEPGETPLDAARRELLEETGFVAPSWLPLLEVSPEPARHTTRAHLFCALGARRVAEPALDAGEEAEVVIIERKRLSSLIESAAIDHGVHIAALLLAKERGYL